MPAKRMGGRISKTRRPTKRPRTGKRPARRTLEKRPVRKTRTTRRPTRRYR